MKKCPLIGKKCTTHDCEFYTHLVGMNPQTGQPTDEWKCAVAWLPLMLVETANTVRQASASVDKVANESAGVKGAVNAMNQTFCNAAQLALEMNERGSKRLLDAGRDESNNPIGDRPCLSSPELPQQQPPH